MRPVLVIAVLLARPSGGDRDPPRRTVRPPDAAPDVPAVVAAVPPGWTISPHPFTGISPQRVESGFPKLVRPVAEAVR